MVCIRCKEAIQDSDRPKYRSKRERESLCKKCMKNIAISKRRKIQRHITGTYEWVKQKKDTIRIRAQRKGLVFELSTDDIKRLYTSPCFYCGNSESNNGHNKCKCMTVDRKDNLAGYTNDNCVPCCFRCNHLKRHHYTFDEMIRLVESRGLHAS